MTRRSAFSVAMLALLLAVCAGLLFATLRQPPIWTLDIGARGDEQFIAGFFEIERGDGAVFRWSGPGAQLRLHGTDVTPNVLQLRLHTDERAAQKGQGLHITRDDQPLATFQLQPGWRIYHTLVQAGSGGATPAIGLETTEALPPVKGRELGIALDQLRVVPLQPTVVAPLVRTLLLTWWVALLATLLWRIAHLALLERRFASRWLHVGSTALIGACIVALAALLATWAHRDPQSLARTLPPMPWVQGLATLALIVGGGRREAEGGKREPVLGSRFSVLGSRFSVLGAFAVLVVAQLLLNTQTVVALGVALALAALAALVYAGLGSEDALARADATPRTAVLALAAIVVAALALRFYRLAELPFGLWRDEARHGLFAIQLLEDPNYRPVYLADNRIQLPALGLYPFALAVKLWGIHLWTMRPITALAGALTVLPLYGLARWLWGRRDIALLAAAFLGVSSWHIIISRFSFPTVFDPLLTLTGLWLLTVRSTGTSEQERTQSRTWLVRLGAWFLAGICVGLALQTYHTGRLAPLAAALLALLVLWRSGWQWRRWLLGGVVALLGFALVAAPLIVYALQHSSDFNARTGSVFLLGTEALHGQAPLTALEESVRRHVLMFNVHGDDNGRHANPGQPMLDFVTGLGFLLGCAVILRRWRDPRSLITFALLGLGLLPSLLSVDSPHGMRSIDSAAYACLIAAIGWVYFGAQFTQQWSGSPRRNTYRWAAIAIPVVALVLNYRIYFVQVPANPEVWQSYYPTHTQAGAYIRDLATHNQGHMPQVFVRGNLVTNPVFMYLTHDLPVQELTDKTPADTVQSDALFVLSGYSYKHDIKRLAPYVSPSAQPFALGPPFPDGVTPSFVVYKRDQ